MNASSKPVDVVDKMLSNYKEGKPLLEDAKLLRGSRLPDQSLGSFGGELHTSLLPQVAASYTHNWKEKDAYIGAYPIDREKTRFYQDFGMEKAGGSTPKSYSVADAERALEPLVAGLAAAKNPGDRYKAEQRIESMLKSSFYEAGVPAKSASGEATRPAELFVYTGRPDIHDRRAVEMQMKPMNAETEKTARATMLAEHKSPEMVRTGELLGRRNESSQALTVVLGVARQDHTEQLTRDHGGKPLNQMMNDIAKQPASPTQERLARFASAMHSGVESANPAVQAKATAMSTAISQLDPAKSTLNDLAKATTEVSAKMSGASNADAAPTASSAQAGAKLADAGGDVKPAATVGTGRDR